MDKLCPVLETPDSLNEIVVLSSLEQHTLEFIVGTCQNSVKVDIYDVCFLSWSLDFRDVVLASFLSIFQSLSMFQINRTWHWSSSELYSTSYKASNCNKFVSTCPA